MRVVFVNRYFYPDRSPTSELLTDLAFKCVEWRFHVSVVTSAHRHDESSVRLPESQTVGDVDIYRVNDPRFGRHAAGRLIGYVFFVYGVRRKLKEIVEDGTVVIIKTDPPLLGMFLMGVVRKKGGLPVNWLQDLFPETLAALWPGLVTSVCLAPVRYFRNRNLKRTGLNIVVGTRTRDYLLSQGVSYGRLWVIRNWPHEETNEQDIEKNASSYKSNWGLKGKFVVGYFGDLGRAHDYETILGAMMALESNPDVVFLFVGGGSLLEKLKRAAAQRGLQNVVYKDSVPRDDLAAALRVADLHLVVLNPRLEGFVVPGKFAGAVAAGRPVLYVGDPKGEIGRLVTRGKCGRAIEVGDSQGLADAIRGLAEDSSALAGMAETAGKVYRKYYRRDELFRRWRVVLNALRQKVAA